MKCPVAPISLALYHVPMPGGVGAPGARTPTRRLAASRPLRLPRPLGGLSTRPVALPQKRQRERILPRHTLCLGNPADEPAGRPRHGARLAGIARKPASETGSANAPGLAIKHSLPAAVTILYRTCVSVTKA